MNRKASITFQPRRFAVSEEAMKRKSQNRIGVRVYCLGMILVAGITLASSRYTDLRRIEPIHGDVAAGARKAARATPAMVWEPGCADVSAPGGQRIDYLYWRLVAFRSDDPSSSPMPGMVQPLSDEDLRNLAVYFSAQKPTTPQPPDVQAAQEFAARPASGQSDGSNTNVSRGRDLYLHGDSARGSPPCQGCHGPDALGPPLRTQQYAAYPSLRGQPSMYLVTRLAQFRDKVPQQTTSDFIMHGVARTLDDESIQAIADFVSACL